MNTEKTLLSSEKEPSSLSTIISSTWFKIEQIETFVGEMDNGGERKKIGCITSVR
jgi:hypothetical protein